MVKENGEKLRLFSTVILEDNVLIIVDFFGRVRHFNLVRISDEMYEAVEVEL